MRFRQAAPRGAVLVLAFGASALLFGSMVIAAGEGCGQSFQTRAAGTNGDSTVAVTGDEVAPMGVTDGATGMVSDGAGMTGDDDGESPPAEVDGSVADGGDPFTAFTFNNFCNGQGPLTGAKCLFAFAGTVGAKVGGIAYGDDYLYIRFTIGVSDTYIGRIAVGGGDLAAIHVPNVKQLARNGAQVYWATESDAATGYAVSRYDTATRATTTPIVFTDPINGSVDIRPKGDGIAAYGLQPSDAGVYVATEVDTLTTDGGATTPSSTCVAGGLEAGTTDVDLHVDEHAAYILGHTGTGIPSELVECLDDGGSAVLGTKSGRVVGAVSMTQSNDEQTVYAVWNASGKIYVETYATGVSVATPRTSASFTTSETIGGARILNIGGADRLYILTAGPKGDLAQLAPPLTGSATFSAAITGVTSGGPFAAPPGRNLSNTQLIYFAGGNVLWESTASLTHP